MHYALSPRACGAFYPEFMTNEECKVVIGALTEKSKRRENGEWSGMWKKQYANVPAAIFDGFKFL